jgi:hypothetical protein
MEAEQTKKPTQLEAKRAKLEQTTLAAAATIAGERKARLEKTERLRAAREDAGQSLTAR